MNIYVSNEFIYKRNIDPVTDKILFSTIKKIYILHILMQTLMIRYIFKIIG